MTAPKHGVRRQAILAGFGLLGLAATILVIFVVQPLARAKAGLEVRVYEKALLIQAAEQGRSRSTRVRARSARWWGFARRWRSEIAEALLSSGR